VIAVPQAANAASARLLARMGFVEREHFVEFDAEQILFSSAGSILPVCHRTASATAGARSRAHVWPPGIDASSPGATTSDEPRVGTLGGPPDKSSVIHPT
jgi:hypothetical protein